MIQGIVIPVVAHPPIHRSRTTSHPEFQRLEFQRPEFQPRHVDPRT